MEKMKVSCVIAFSLSHYHQSDPCCFWFFSSFLSGVGISNHSMIMPVPLFLSHNPFLLLFSSVVEVDQVTCQQQGSQFYL